MFKTKNNRSIFFILIFAFSLVAAFFCFKELSSNAYAAEGWEYLGDFNGVYSIVSYSSNGTDYGFDICGGNLSTADSNAPNLIVYAIGKPAQANHRFEFYYIEKKNGVPVYGITSCLDRQGRLDVKSGSFLEGTEIWYYEKNDSSAQRWVLRSKDGGKTVQIICADHMDFCIAYNSSKQLVLTKNKNDSKTFWKLKNIVGNYGVNMHTYVDDDNMGYRINSNNEVLRYLNPLDGNKGYISNVVNVGVRGQGLEKTTYNGTQAFAVPYSQKFYIDTNFVYSNSVYGEWTRTKELGKAKCEGGNLPWCLSSDSYKFSSEKDGEKQVEVGLYIIEISDDNVNWRNYRIISFGTDRNANQWEIDGSLLAKGTYVRISYLFEIYAYWTTWATEWYNHLLFGIPIGGHNVDHYEWKNIREVSDSFYVCVDGFGENDLGVLRFESKRNWSVDNVSVEGFSIEETRKSQTLTDGAMTFSGFTVKSDFSAYKVEVSVNSGAYKTISSGYQSSSPGNYNIRATSRFGKTRAVTIYVGEKDITKTYFGASFSNVPNEVAFIQGKRILSGTSNNLDSLGISLNYAFAKVPVYEKGCTYNIKNTDSAPQLKGKISFSGVSGDGEIIINDRGHLSGVLNEVGYYSASFTTSNTVGDVVTFAFNWWVVENAPGPVINETLIKTKSQETYDLIPVYYGVQVDNGHYQFKDETGKDIEKSQVIYYAFAQQDSALAFALRVEKEYAMRESDGMFSYQHANNPLIRLNEFELYQQMYEKAKSNVKIRYFSNRNSLSMRIFTPYDEDGNRRKYDDGITETIAYCLEYNTNYCIVTTDKVELAALTARQPYINNYTFISVPIDSSTVTLTDEDGNKHQIEYDKSVQDQLVADDAKSGKYVVEETNVYGDKSQYEVYYIAPNSPNKTILTVSLNDDMEIEINKSKVEAGYDTIFEAENHSPIKSFCIKSGKNSCDNHAFILVEKKGNNVDDSVFHACDIYSLDHTKMTYSESGLYKISVEDRMGSFYSFNILSSTEILYKPLSEYVILV